MSELSIDLERAEAAFEPGEVLNGSVCWRLGRAARALELRLFWFTQGRGMQDAAVVQTIRFERPLDQETRSFRFVLPEAPYSFAGKLISLTWALELIVEGAKESTRRELVLGPGGQQVTLPTGTVVESEGRAGRGVEILIRAS